MNRTHISPAMWAAIGHLYRWSGATLIPKPTAARPRRARLSSQSETKHDSSLCSAWLSKMTENAMVPQKSLLWGFHFFWGNLSIVKGGDQRVAQVSDNYSILYNDPLWERRFCCYSAWMSRPFAISHADASFSYDLYLITFFIFSPRH